MDKEKSVTKSGRPAIGPLFAWAVGLTALGFAAARRANNLRWPSTNSVVRLWVIDDAELTASCKRERTQVTVY